MVDFPETGSRVELDAHNQTYTGILLPQESDYLVLKLDSGYNIGIDPKHISAIRVTGSPVKPAVPLLFESHQDSQLPVLGLLHTGGTIASRVDYKTGAVVADFNPDNILELFPELKDIAQITSVFVGNMFSGDFRFAHFNKIAQQLHQLAISGVRNIIITSGTDNLHYLSATLSFLFKDYDVGVLVVGSQRSSDRGSADAALNLLCAAQFLTTTQFTGVGVCMHASSADDDCVIISGVHARKMHSSRRDAFESINAPPLAYVSFENKSIHLLQELRQPETTIPPPTAPQLNDTLKIGLCTAHPQFFAEELDVYDSFHGLILSGTGLGHFPVTHADDLTAEHEQILSKITALAKNMPVVMATQTIHGAIHLHVYAYGRALFQAGVLGHLSAMTPEVAFIKLAVLLSQGLRGEELATQLMTNWVGEHDIEPFDAYQK